MFSRGSKGCLGRALRVAPFVRAMASASPPPPQWGRYALVGASAAALSAALVTWRSADKSFTPLDRSTTPLELLDTPRYATADEYRLALKLIGDIVGPEHLLNDEVNLDMQLDAFFVTHHPPHPDTQRPGVVVLPESTAEVLAIMQIAHKFRVPVVPTLGLTSLEGHYMHTRGPYTIALSFSQMDQVVAFHPDDLDVVVQPGVGWQDLDAYLLLQPNGLHLMFGPDPGPGAQIGGMVASSCSGTNAFRYGTMKENVVQLTVVLADGTVVRTRQRPRKSAAGYDLTRLFIGLEGTLGIVTEATLKLHVRPAVELVSIATFDTIGDAAATAQHLLSRGTQPNAIEILDSTMMGFVNAQGGGARVFAEAPTLFLKFGGETKRAVDEQVALLREVALRHHVVAVELLANASDNAVLWAARRNGLWLTVDHGRKVLADPEDVQVWTTDVAVPLLRLTEMIRDTNADLLALGLGGRFLVMGHVGDGNCHFLLLYNTPDYGKVQTVVDRMVQRALALEGTCTGEHGVGVGKRRYLPLEYGTDAVDLMRHLKVALDPRRILNPDKVVKIDRHDRLDEELDSGHLKEGHACCH